MNFLYISPHFPDTSRLFVRALAGRGVKVLGLGDAPENQLDPETRANLAGYAAVGSLGDASQVVPAVRHLIDRYGPIARLDSNIEFWLESEALLRDAFKVPGMALTDVRHLRSKLFMKQAFARANIPTAPCEAVETLEQVRVFARRNGFPLFFKPDTGVGAGGAFRVDNDADLVRRLEGLPPGYIVEPFVRGRIVTYDGLIDADGKILFAASHAYRPVSELIAENGDTMYHNILPQPPELVRLGREMVRSLNVRERFFHGEFFEADDGRYIAIELNVRPPGGTFMHTMNYSADTDLFDRWAAMISGQELGDTEPATPYWHVAHVGRRDQFTYQLGHEALCAALGPNLATTFPMPPTERAGLGDVCYIIRSQTWSGPGGLKQLAELVLKR